MVTLTGLVKRTAAVAGADSSAAKSVVCVYEPAEPSWQLTSFTTNREELIKVQEKYGPSVVVIEACALSVRQAIDARL